MISMTPNSSPRPVRSVRVLVADRSLMSAQLLAQTLKQDRHFAVAVVSSSAQLMAAGPEADVAVISIDLSGGMDDTMRITHGFNERYPKVRLIVLMDNPRREMVVDAFRCGASGVFSRSQPLADFLKCVDRVSQGEIWASRGEIDYLLSALRGSPGSRMIGCEDIRVLTKREVEVVRQAGEGLQNKEIAEKLGLSEHTVKNYIFRAFEKIGVSNRVELLFYLLRQERASSDAGESEASKHRKAAQEGFAAAQLALGNAHYRGEGTEKDELTAYYWLRLAEKSAERILAESRRTLEELRKSVNSDALQELERSLSSDNSRLIDSSKRLGDSKRKHFSIDGGPTG